MFCIYLRTNSDLCHLQHKLIGFYNPDEECLQRGTDWVFKNESSLCFVFKGLTSTLLISLAVWLTIGSLPNSVNVYIKRHWIYSHYLPSFRRCQLLLPVHISAPIHLSSAQFIAKKKYIYIYISKVTQYAEWFRRKFKYFGRWQYWSSWGKKFLRTCV